MSDPRNDHSASQDRFCSACGREIAPGARFCDQCGRRISAAPPEEGDGAARKRNPAVTLAWIGGCGALLALTIVAATVIVMLFRVHGSLVSLSREPAQVTERGASAEGVVPDTGPPIHESPNVAEPPPANPTVGGGATEPVEEPEQIEPAFDIEGFDPTTVDREMLPVFYGVLSAIAFTDAAAMREFATPALRAEMPSNYFPPGIDHISYELGYQSEASDGSVRMMLDQLTYDRTLQEEIIVTWDITLDEVDGQWRVTEISHTNG